MNEVVESAFNKAVERVQQFNTELNRGRMIELSRIISTCFKRGGKVLICGNGGSNCDALHFAEEFTGRFRKDRRPLPVIALSESSHITCVGNDYGFAEIFSRAVEAYGKKGDVLIGISTSGDSENVVRAVKKGVELDLITVGLLGKKGGKLKDLCQHNLIVEGETTDRIQEVHMMILHIIIELVERDLFPELY